MSQPIEAVMVSAGNHWWAEFRATAQVALKGRPDLLLQLGL